MPSPLVIAQLSGGGDLSGVNNALDDLKIVELAEAVEGRINIVLNNGKVSFFIFYFFIF